MDSITISLQDLGWLVIIIAVVVLLIYLIKLTRNLIETAKHTNKILADAEIISALAAEKAQELDGVVDDVAETVGSLAELIRGNQSIVKALTNIINSLAGLKNLANEKKK